MGKGAPLRPLSPPHLIDDDGLASGDFASDLDELARLFQPLDIESDDLGVLILTEIAHHLVEVEVAAVAQPDGLADAHVLVGQSVHGINGGAAALRRYSHVARSAQAQGILERGVEPGSRIDEAQRIGPDNLDSTPLGDILKFILETSAHSGAHFTEAPADQDYSLHPLGDALLYCSQSKLGGNDHHG
ncbi:MAG: hypothetical protein NT134_00280 [Chloroflexi bacterium]|nr:hypothetical protein [Chloroflexota bacterium]